MEHNFHQKCFLKHFQSKEKESKNRGLALANCSLGHGDDKFVKGVWNIACSQAYGSDMRSLSFLFPVLIRKDLVFPILIRKLFWIRKLYRLFISVLFIVLCVSMCERDHHIN